MDNPVEELLILVRTAANELLTYHEDAVHMQSVGEQVIDIIDYEEYDLSEESSIYRNLSLARGYLCWHSILKREELPNLIDPLDSWMDPYPSFQIVLEQAWKALCSLRHEPHPHKVQDFMVHLAWTLAYRKLYDIDDRVPLLIVEASSDVISEYMKQDSPTKRALRSVLE